MYTWPKPHSSPLVASGIWNVRQGPFRESPLGYKTDIHLNWEYGVFIPISLILVQVEKVQCKMFALFALFAFPSPQLKLQPDAHRMPTPNRPYPPTSPRAKSSAPEHNTA